jgi:hypothetical protein
MQGQVDPSGGRPHIDLIESAHPATVQQRPGGIKMTNVNDERLARRTFLKQMATVAGTAPLAPTLLGASAASAQTPAAPGKQETAHQTERLAAYAAALRYEDLPDAVVQCS